MARAAATSKPPNIAFNDEGFLFMCRFPLVVDVLIFVLDFGFLELSFRANKHPLD